MSHLQKVFLLIRVIPGATAHCGTVHLVVRFPPCALLQPSPQGCHSYMFATNALPFLRLSPSILLRSLHLLLCQSTCLSASTHLSICLSSLQSLCGKVFESGTACSACQLQSIQHGGQLRRPNLPWQSAETARPSKMWSLCGQDNVDLTCPLCNRCGSGD